MCLLPTLKIEQVLLIQAHKAQKLKFFQNTQHRCLFSFTKYTDGTDQQSFGKFLENYTGFYLQFLCQMHNLSDASPKWFV